MGIGTEAAPHGVEPSPADRASGPPGYSALFLAVTAFAAAVILLDSSWSGSCSSCSLKVTGKRTSFDETRTVDSQKKAPRAPP